VIIVENTRRDRIQNIIALTFLLGWERITITFGRILGAAGQKVFTPKFSQGDASA
jgi:hypothetical protein